MVAGWHTVVRQTTRLLPRRLSTAEQNLAASARAAQRQNTKIRSTLPTQQPADNPAKNGLKRRPAESAGQNASAFVFFPEYAAGMKPDAFGLSSAMPSCRSQSRMGIEIMMETSTRSARNRRVVAILGWGVLVGTAMILWNGRLQDSIRSVGDEPVAFVLAAFSAFVGVFAWLLFNPGRRAASESPVLFFAAAATLFPPPIIGFCLMPVDSPLRGWLAVGLFLLCVIAVLSHVPDDFFGVPRGRNSYMTPIPTFDSVDDAIMSPEAAWFTFEDLTRILPDAERPSLSPRSYLQQDTTRLAPSSVRGQDKVASEVDDILGSDFDLGLLDEDLTDFDRQSPQRDSSLRTSFNQPRSASDRRKRESSRHVTETTTRADDQAEQLANANVFESFERSARSGSTDSTNRYTAASGNSATSRQRKQRFQTANAADRNTGSHRTTAHNKATAATAASIRNQLAAKSRVVVPGQSGSGLAASSRQSFLNQSTDFTPTERRRKSSDVEIEHGTLDVHRGQQLSDSSAENRKSKSSGSSRQQDQRRNERQRKDAAKKQQAEESAAAELRAKQERAEQDRRQSQTESRREKSEQSSRNERVSRFEQRQQVTNRQSEDRDDGQSGRSKDGSRETDRKLVRQKSSHEADAESTGLVSTDEAKLKRRSALDIATAGILGAGAAAGLAKSDSTSDPATPDLDAAASQGLFGTVRDLFNKPKNTGREEELTGAEEFESAVDSVDTDRRAGQDIAIERTIDASGAEMVEGVAVVRFERGQKKANIHIPFSPPMNGKPEVEVECVGGEQIRLKVPMSEPYGMRIEARRSNTSEALEAEIGFAAMAEQE